MEMKDIIELERKVRADIAEQRIKDQRRKAKEAQVAFVSNAIAEYQRMQVLSLFLAK